MKHVIPVLSAILFVVGCSGQSSDESIPGEDGAPPGAPEPGATLPGGPPGTTTPGLPPAENPGAPGAPPTAPGTRPPGASTGPFAGAPAYIATLGPSTIDTTGKGNGHLSFNAAGNPAGRACLTCHDGQGKGGAPGFVFAGTVYEDKAATKPAARIEVRIVGADGAALSAYTDVNGNFFFRAGAGGAAPPPAVAGIRNATVTRAMVNKINEANCNTCHGDGSRITL